MAMMQKSDEELMLLYQQDDAQAFEMLYRRHKDPLYRYLLRQCQIPGVAEELFQDVWTRLIVARRRYRASARFTTFLYQVARNRLIDYYRANGRNLEDATGDEAVDAPAARATQPEHAVETRQQANRVLALIEALPALQREAFLLHEEAGLTLDEIGEVTGAGRETVKSRLRYALGSLRKGMEEWL